MGYIFNHRKHKTLPLYSLVCYQNFIYVVAEQVSKTKYRLIQQQDYPLYNYLCQIATHTGRPLSKVKYIIKDIRELSGSEIY